MSNEPFTLMRPRHDDMRHDGHLYLQTNETHNAVIHYPWSANGTITEVERVATGGAGSGILKPISGQESAPNAFEDAGSVILSPGHRWLFATNGGDNSVSCFGVSEDGTLGTPTFRDGGGGSPFFSAFLHNTAFPHNRPDTFVIGYAVSDGVGLGHIDEDGNIAINPFHLDVEDLTLAKDSACPKVRGDGTFRALCGDVSSGPSDNWVTPDGAQLYQIYGNASKLVDYAVQPEGALKEITRARIPYNSPEGWAEF